jgi:RNA polymerase sigma factor (sigma-70 family)
LLQHLRETTDPAGTPADADLLERFVIRRDEAAFAALVARHGPMVLGVCRRLLQDLHDAEDAFQATFLVLARKAGTLGRGDPIGAWLHGVACRTAAHARAARARRRAHERRETAMRAAQPTPAVLWEDLKPLLDEEIRRLPDKYRVPVVLCYLGAKTYDEAAREIGCPKGTLATRLAKARELLRERLSDRGVTLAAAGLAAIFAENARAGVPASLHTATVAAATSAGASVGVATLTEGVLKAMSGPKLKAVTLLLVTLGILAVGAGALAYHATGDAQPTGTGTVGAADTAKDPAPPEKARRGGADEFPWGDADDGVQVRLRPRQFRWNVGETPTFDVDLRNRGHKPVGVVRPADIWEVELDSVWYGRKIEKAAVPETPLEAGTEVKDWLALPLDGKWLRDVTGQDRYESDKNQEALPLAPGKHKVRVAFNPRPGLRPVSNAVEIEVLKGDEKEYPPRGSRPIDPGWIQVVGEKKAFLFRPDGTGRTETIAPVPFRRQLSPDGKSITYVISPSGDEAVYVADIDGKNARVVSPDKVVATSPTWSPDGRRIAFAAMRGQQWQVYVADRDGGNVRQLTGRAHGAWMPKFAPDGRLAFLSGHQRQGKLQPADLVIADGTGNKAIERDGVVLDDAWSEDGKAIAIRGVPILDYAWSRDGKAIAYSKLGALVFHEVGSGKEQEITFQDIDKRLNSHAAWLICWSPDDRAVVCSIMFLGDRQFGGPKIFGDDELFVIPRAGKPSWFGHGETVRHIEWIKDVATGERPGKERPAAPDPGPGQPEPASEVDIRSEDGKVLIGADQIQSYDWATHTLTLAPKAREELAAQLRRGERTALVTGVPFAVAVGGKNVYAGKFTTNLSSVTLPIPVIVVDAQDLEPALGADRLRIQLGYPGPTFFKGEDPRGDLRVRRALEAGGKLAKAK